jgi:FkbM family methyltransferase
MRNGFFLDSGAADGVRASNTLLLEREFGWRGICVEPNDRMYASLIRNRRCHSVNCCLYDKEGHVEFLEAANELGGIMNEYHPDHLRYAKATWHLENGEGGRPVTVQKPTRTLRSLLDECGAPPVIDYWSLDTEGSELAILRSFPYERYTFRVLTVEHNRYAVREEICAFLESLGYARIGTFGIDDCYVKGDVPQSPGWRSRVWSRC